MNIMIIYKKNFIRLMKVIFCIYLMGLAYVLFFISTRVDTYNNVNIVPFRTIRLYIEYFDYFTFSIWFLNLFGNILLFIPLGLMLPIVSKSIKRFPKTFIVSLFSILIVEIMQNIFKVGELDIDDIILNILGVTIGFFLYKLLHYLFMVKFKNKITIL